MTTAAEAHQDYLDAHEVTMKALDVMAANKDPNLSDTLMRIYRDASVAEDVSWAVYKLAKRGQ